MGPILHSKERILVKIKFECRPVLMSKHHDLLLLWYFTGRHWTDCVFVWTRILLTKTTSEKVFTKYGACSDSWGSYRFFAKVVSALRHSCRLSSSVINIRKITRKKHLSLIYNIPIRTTNNEKIRHTRSLLLQQTTMTEQNVGTVEYS